jgi:hypothetical protein
MPRTGTGEYAPKQSNIGNHEDGEQTSVLQLSWLPKDQFFE